MELLQLKYFQTVARLEHMTQAAEKLKIAQPSLSKTISRLEEDLGVPLFDRQGRHIKLNQYGRALLMRVDRIFTELSAARNELLDLHGLHQETVHLAVSIPTIVPELFSSFLTTHPSISFQQMVAIPTSMVPMLERGEIDMCISSSPIEGPDIEWMPLLKDEMMLMVPNDHPLADKKIIDLMDAQNEPFISFNTGQGTKSSTEYYCELAGFEPKITFEGDETPVIARLVQKGLGIAFVSRLVWYMSPHESVRLVHIKHPVCERTIGVAHHKRHHHSPVTQDFLQHIIDYFSKVSQKMNDPVS